MSELTGAAGGDRASARALARQASAVDAEASQESASARAYLAREWQQQPLQVLVAASAVVGAACLLGVAASVAFGGGKRRQRRGDSGSGSCGYAGGYSGRHAGGAGAESAPLVGQSRGGADGVAEYQMNEGAALSAGGAATTVVARAQARTAAFTPLFDERAALPGDAAIARAMAEEAVGVSQYADSMAGMNTRGQFQPWAEEAPSI